MKKISIEVTEMLFSRKYLNVLVHTTHRVENYTAIVMDEFKLHITLAKFPNQMFTGKSCDTAYTIWNDL